MEERHGNPVKAERVFHLLLSLPQVFRGGRSQNKKVASPVMSPQVLTLALAA